MAEDKFKVLLVSDFNISNFSGYLSNDIGFPALEPNVAPYGQVMRLLLDRSSEVWKKEHDFSVVWTRPEMVSETFGKALGYQNILIRDVLDEVERFADLVLAVKNEFKSIFIPTWVLSQKYKLFENINMKHEVGLDNILMRMNLCLAEKFEKSSNVYLLNAKKWFAQSDGEAFNPKLWYMAKIPFGDKVFQNAVVDIKSFIRGVLGLSSKLVILDLDNTLWGGIVGEVGWQNLKLGGHDPLGEAFSDFQKTLKALTHRGILLGIVSKNQESVALEAINSHSEMILKIEDFAGWRINWDEKAKNVLDLLLELKLGVQSAIFIDDQPIERFRVKDALPEIIVPDWPENPMLYKSTFLSFPYFNPPSISKEDSERTKMYVSDKQRTNLKLEVGNYEDWLKRLDVRIVIEELNKSNLLRVSQLLNKTNQMNLRTRRMPEEELESWVQSQNRKLWAFKVSDKFGDMGLSGLVSLEIEGQFGKIIDFVLSCRIMGRMVEESMLYVVAKYAQSEKLKELIAEYISTPKNTPCLEFWKKKSKFLYNEPQNIFSLKINGKYPKPDCVQLEGI